MTGEATINGADFLSVCFCVRHTLQLSRRSLTRIRVGVGHQNPSIVRGPPPTAITVKIDHSDPELQEEILVTKVDGSEERIIFKCRTNGEEGKSLLNGSPGLGNAR
jgi:hypothetical protein